ncbi:MAG TPA: dihydropteroate synthase [Candidatus Eremiobacteraeota bacterium]|nr:MAG: 5-methyltetrahydrofolate:corrinoid/iron-sulfur protein co-methyltransferase [bacterium ADurb.Bin363]HPZ07208.1 dihydropteroate synthase [Candidatus Eremiobacteraeota bacterium]
MIIVGELINSTRSKVKEAIKEKNEEYIRKLVRLQVSQRANFLDVNSAMSLKSEVEDLKWLVGIIQSETDIPLSIDTPAIDAMEEGLKLCRTPPMINSITNEKKREILIKLAKDYNAHVIALPLGGKKKMPVNLQERMEEAKELLSELDKGGIDRNKIYLDVLIIGVGSNPEAGKIALQTLREYKKEFPSVKTIAGLSNISFGLPYRRLLNRTFLVMMIESGLDAVIIDPADEDLIDTMKTAMVLTGRDKYCREYIKYMKGKK